MTPDEMPAALFGRLIGEADSPGYAGDLARRLVPAWKADAGRLVRLRGERGARALVAWLIEQVGQCEPRFAEVAARRAGPGLVYRVRGTLDDQRAVTFRLILGPNGTVTVEDN